MSVGVLRRFLAFFFPLAMMACTGPATTTGFAPVTSVLIRAESIVPAPLCGKAVGQIAKYTAVISSRLADGGAAPLAGQTYECFADAMFANMSGTQFDIDVFEWSASAYAAASTLPTIETQLRDPNQVTEALKNLRALMPTARRQCSAVQVSNVQAVARCDEPVTDAGADAPTDARADAAKD